MDGILLINKPAGYTSHDIVGIVRKKLHTKKVGHCGTLDPDATGVLVVCVNKATKAIQFLMSDTKVYRATLSLGKSTDTYDASGKILEEKEVGQISQAQVIDVLNSFLGKSSCLPVVTASTKIPSFVYGWPSSPIVILSVSGAVSLYASMIFSNRLSISVNRSGFSFKYSLNVP